jgi:hypothetical protein
MTAPISPIGNRKFTKKYPPTRLVEGFPVFYNTPIKKYRRNTL